MKTTKSVKQSERLQNQNDEQCVNAVKVLPVNESHYNRSSVNVPRGTPAPEGSNGSPSLGWRGVFFTGPEPEQDRRGEKDEIPVWHVFVGDQDANPVSKVYRVLSFLKADTLAVAMSKDRRLELIAEAQPAN